MAVVRRIPYRTHFGLEQQIREMQRLLSAMNSSGRSGGEERGEQSSASAAGASETFNPSADVYREDGNLVVEFELPGVDVENDIDVSVDDGVLTVKGSRSSDRSEERDGVYLRERRSGSFSRSLSLPDGTDPDDVEADYTDGVLTITVPLPDEDETSRQPRKISVGSGGRESEGKDDDGSSSSEPAKKSPAKKSGAKQSGAKQSTSKPSASKKKASKQQASKQSASKKSGSGSKSSKNSEAKSETDGS